MNIESINFERNTCVMELSSTSTSTTVTATTTTVPSITVPRVASQEAVHTIPISAGDTQGGATPLPSPSTAPTWPANPWGSSQWPWSAPVGQNVAPPPWIQSTWPGFPWMPPFPVMPTPAPTWPGPLPTA